MRVTLTDGTQVTLDDPTIRNDSINGVALSDGSTIEVQRVSASKIFNLIVGVPVGLFVALLVGCSTGDGCDFE